MKGLVRNVPVWGTVSDNLTLEYRRLGTSISANIDKVNSLYIYIYIYQSVPITKEIVSNINTSSSTCLSSFGYRLSMVKL